MTKRSTIEPIYHLAPAARWHAWPPGVAYLPAEYETDGFVHCTAGEELMLVVANRFYRAVPGAFVLLVLDPACLTAPLRWERPQPDDGLAPLFPHIYGLIDAAAIIGVHAAQRDAEGTFVGWITLIDHDA